jgi:hypothetical protein
MTKMRVKMTKTASSDRVSEAARRIKEICEDYPEINFLVVGVEGGEGKGLGGMVISARERRLSFADAVTMSEVALGTMALIARESRGDQLADDLEGYASELARKSGILLKGMTPTIEKMPRSH